MTKWRFAVGMTLVLSVLPGVVLGQPAPRQAIAAGRIVGRLIDPVGEPLADQPVQLKVSAPPTAPSIARTDANGRFQFDVLVGASYEVVFEVSGFSRLAIPGKSDGSTGRDLGSVVLMVAPIGDPTEVPTYVAPLSQSLNPARRKFRGRYTNEDYGYSVNIPFGLVAWNAPAPAPNHGFAIELGDESRVWVDASYEVVPQTLGRLNGRLGKLKSARRSWVTKEQGRQRRHEGIIARRRDRPDPILYTIQLETDAAHRREGLRIFEALTRSFRTIPIPR